jgi:hypothetical protein
LARQVGVTMSFLSTSATEPIIDAVGFNFALGKTFHFGSFDFFADDLGELPLSNSDSVTAKHGGLGDLLNSSVGPRLCLKCQERAS